MTEKNETKLLTDDELDKISERAENHGFLGYMIVGFKLDKIESISHSVNEKNRPAFAAYADLITDILSRMPPIFTEDLKFGKTIKNIKIH